MAKLDIEAEAKTFVQASPERVYDAFATAEGLDGWFTRGAKVDARPGGELLFRWRDWGADLIDAVAHGKVIEAKRAERFAFEWWDADPAEATTVELTFAPARGGTIVHVREYGFPDTSKGRGKLAGNASGWGEALTLLRFWVEHRLGQPRGVAGAGAARRARRGVSGLNGH